MRELQEDAGLDTLDEEHQHRDQAVVAVDVERSLWALTSGNRERPLMGQVVQNTGTGWVASQGKVGTAHQACVVEVRLLMGIAQWVKEMVLDNPLPPPR